MHILIPKRKNMEMSLSSLPISNQDLSGDFWNWCIWEKALSMISFAPSGFSFFWRQPEAHTLGKFIRVRSVAEAERSSFLDKVKFKWRSIYWEAHGATDPNHVLQFHVINDKVEFLYLFPWLPSLYFNSRRLLSDTQVWLSSQILHRHGDVPADTRGTVDAVTVQWAGKALLWASDIQW